MTDDYPISPLARHAERWDISEHLNHWTAERTEGTSVRIVAARSAAELAEKLDAIEPREEVVRHDAGGWISGPCLDPDEEERNAAHIRIWGCER